MPETFCPRCRDVLNNGHTYTPQEELEGRNKRDYRGDYICKFCGISYKSLNIHLKKKHNISMREYVIKFGIQEQFRLLNRGTGEKLSLETRRKNAKKKIKYENEKAFYAMRVLRKHKDKIKGSDKYCL